MANEFTERMRSIGYLSHGRTRDTRVKEYRAGRDQHRVKETIDVYGNSTMEHATKDDRVDVEIRPKVVDLTAKVQG
jgi:hypothetical protein